MIDHSQNFHSLDSLNEEDRSFETLSTTHPTRRHIPEDLGLRQHRCENLRSGNCLIQTNLVKLKLVSFQFRLESDVTHEFIRTQLPKKKKKKFHTRNFYD
jgi:hypothetical protein